MCGGELRQSSGVIKSPGYPEDYPAFSSCTWTISADDGHQIVLNITSLDLESHEDCQADYLEVRNGGTENSPLFGRFCGKRQPMQIKSHTNRMFVRFISDRFRNAKGFLANYYTMPTGCNGVMRAPYGSVSIFVRVELVNTTVFKRTLWRFSSHLCKNGFPGGLNLVELKSSEFGVV